MTDPCVVCIQNIEIKPKPGIFPCLGCEQMFCTQHVAFHRQELANELDLIIGDRNELQDALDRHEDELDVSAQMNLIDEWVKKTVEQIHQIADNVRERIIRLAEEQKTTLKDRFAQLSKQLDTFRENENFYEKDIKRLKEECTNLKLLLNSLDINVTVTDISSSLAQAVTLRQTEEKAVESLSFLENLMKHQKPYKRIEIPHDGSIYMLNDVVLLRSDNDFTSMDLKTNSLQSCHIMNSCYSILCSTTYLNGFLYADSRTNSQIKLLRITGRNLGIVKEFRNAIEKISRMVCWIDRMMFIYNGMGYNNCVEEWSLKDLEKHGQQPIEPVHFWRPPLMCESNETIGNISFDDQRIVLLITYTNNSDKNRIEFRTRNMYVIGRVLLNDYKIAFSSILCGSNDGWLLGDKNFSYSPWHFTLIDDNLIRREQKLLSTHGIIEIEVIKYSSNKSVLAVHRKNTSVNTPAYGRSHLSLDLYEI